MDTIRLATPEEIEAIKEGADLTSQSSVLTFGGKEMAVLRRCSEVDPLFNSNDGRRKAMFIWGIENILRFNGVEEYYFNVPVSDENYLKIVQSWGAEQTSKEPEFRFKKRL